MGTIPNTVARTSHAITLKTLSGQTIGLIKQWKPNLTREVTALYEINSATTGDPVENIPGNAKGLTIDIQRYDLYTVRMEQAFGSASINWITDQDNPFQIQEVWKFPNNNVEAWVYSGCWFNLIGRTFQSDDQRMVLVNAQLTYLKRNPVQLVV